MKPILIVIVLFFSRSVYAVALDKICQTEMGTSFNLSMNNHSISINGVKRRIYASKSDNDPKTLKSYTDYWAGEDRVKVWNFVSVNVEHETGKVIGYIAISPQPAMSFECK